MRKVLSKELICFFQLIYIAVIAFNCYTLVMTIIRAEGEDAEEDRVRKKDDENVIEESLKEGNSSSLGCE